MKRFPSEPRSICSGSGKFFIRRGAIGVLGLGLLVLLPGALQARDYRIVSEGAERLFRVAGENAVLEIAADGTIGEPLSASPRVVVRAAREAEMPELARGVGAMKWSRTRVGLHYNLEFESLARALEALVKLQAQGREASLAIRRQKHSRFTPRDPLFKDQWHLRNTGQLGGTKGIDLNISEAWKTRRGKGVAIAVIDDGLEINHPDLVANCFTVASGMHRDFNSNDANPSPERGNDHGTAVAGVLASPSNTLGGLGVAPEAKLAGLRLTADATDGEMEASAFAWKNDAFAIYNNSWGPSDDGKTLEGPAAIARDAILAGTKFGRKGRGNIYVWACGNGRQDADESNYDGYSNLPQTIAVGALSDQAALTSESERGANVVVVAPSSSAGRQGLVCADLVGRRGYNTSGENDGNVIPLKNNPDLNYTNDFGMTSGATPQVSGVVALMLQANPGLGWRDVQEILISTAQRVSPTDADWKKNSAGLFFNHKFGAGLVDATAAVNKAIGWKNLGAATSVNPPLRNLSLAIPDDTPAGVEVVFDLSDAKKFPSLRVEHVLFTVSASHSYRGDLKFVLTSPSGMTSVVEPRENDDGTSFSSWPFLSVRHWGESSTGRWKLRVIDTFSGDSGRLTSASLSILGTRRMQSITLRKTP